MIRKFINDFILSRYSDKSYLEQQKAGVLVRILLIVIVLALLFLLYLPFFEASLLAMSIRIIIVFASIGLLFLIKKGHLALAGYLMFTFIFAALWGVMYLDTNSLIIKTDTLVLVVCAFSAGALMIGSRQWSIVFFFAGNVLVLGLFVLHIEQGYAVSRYEALEYFADGIIGLFFITFVSYQTIKINRLAMEKAMDAIHLAESEAERNKRLSESLEQKVLQRTEELSLKNKDLEQEILERQKAEIRLKETQQIMIESAHKAGMAEIATDNLHNIGNVLNSVKTSAYLLDESIKEFPMEGFHKSCRLLLENRENLAYFLTHQETGQKLIDYLLNLDKQFSTLLLEVETNASRISDKVKAIEEVIASQQDYIGTSAFTETLVLEKVIEDALALLSDLLQSEQIQVKKVFQPSLNLSVQKSKLLHTLINLIKNAIQAMMDMPAGQRMLEIRSYQEGESVCIEIADNGTGIEEKNLNRIFNHGFTTHKDGFGFGLHSCANYLDEMGARITAYSDGPGKGATFRIIFAA